MKAIVQDRYGSADVLEMREIPKPVIGDDEVLVRVRAAGFDPGVWHIMTGRPYMMRIMGFGLRAPKSRVRGFDVAGEVGEVGSRVTRFEEGSEVFGLCDGSFAEYARVKENRLVEKPAAVSFEQAAVVPTSAMTALQGLRDHGDLSAGRHVLIIGAAGGVGSFAVQIAKAFGAEVTGVCSTGKVDLVAKLGADHVVDYTRQEITSTGQRYDLILDTAGNRTLSLLRRALADDGRLVIVGGERGNSWTGGTGRQLRALLVSPFMRRTLRSFIATARLDDLLRLRELVEEGRLLPVIDRTFPLRQVPDAVRYWERNHPAGKIAITI